MKFEELLEVPFEGQIELRVCNYDAPSGYNTVYRGELHGVQKALETAYGLGSYFLQMTVSSCYAAYDGEIFTVIELEDE